MKRIIQKTLCAASALAFLVALSGTTWASSGAPDLMPWDGPLNSIAGYLTDVAAPVVVKLALGAVAILFAVSGTSASTRQLARLVVGTSLALIAVRLFNYLLPY